MDKEIIDDEECRRCGKCCKTYAGRDTWCHGDYTKKEDLLLRKERLKYPEWDDTDICWMLIEDESYMCLVEKVLGRDKKPWVCREWPKTEEKWKCTQEKENEV